ncbi:MAG: DnaJ domain-containing protein [Phormidesmis sp. RL_2_1]|nr:DnaJ domain-containing protein [Phormidesmis sp. RL_2_1]
MPSSSGDYYRRLHLSRNASRREIRAAFRRLARQYHPDLHSHRPGAIVKFRALQEAYEVLIDQVRRQRYDQYCEQGESFEHQGSQNQGSQNQGSQNQGLQNQGSQNRHIPLTPHTPTDFYMRGVSYVLARRYRAALGDYTQAIALDDGFAEAYLRRAEVRYRLKDDPGVLADCQRAIALDASEAKTYFFQGMARYRMDYVQSAIAAFTDAIACDPEEAQYYYRRGMAYEDLHDVNAAAKDLRRAAKLFFRQGNVANHQRLQQYLRQFGLAGRSRPVKFFGQLAQSLTHLVGGRSALGRQFEPLRPIPQRRATDFPSQEFPFKKDIADQQTTSHPLTEPSSTEPSSTEPSPNKPHGNKPHGNKSHKNKEPKETLPPNPRNRPPAHRPSIRPSQQSAWAPGVSSRPRMDQRSPERPGSWRPGSLLMVGMGNLLKLLSNPGGEMVPLYRQLSSRQVTLVGYGLAVMANLCWVLSGTQYLETHSWLIASRLWASGGLMFVAMVLVSVLARARLGIRSLWVADIFMLGAALMPLGLWALITVWVNQQTTLSALSIDSIVMITTLWAFSHTILTLYNGLSRIHNLPQPISAWLTPTLLSLGIAAGMVTWRLLVF